MPPGEVLEFWFGRDAKTWFGKDPQFDADIRSRFLPLYERAAAGELAGWKQAPGSCLALVIALDQFPRNMFRGTARAFAADALALEAGCTIVARGWDRNFSIDERTFAYLPFEHSESLEDQNRSCELMRPLGEETYRYAVRHREIIERFGRFPHRNAVLGRESTPEELEFLSQPGSSF
ncbi:MAG TPA: DUF924 family protein [Burkholderiales bacterium]|jgi:uncharacterized protein (DUF924 family)|nr:DUF924 family protein [Burkholderiales bacterium]